MLVTKTVQETRALIKNWKKKGKTIGLVPTMGFLHEGFPKHFYYTSTAAIVSFFDHSGCWHYNFFFLFSMNLFTSSAPCKYVILKSRLSFR